MWIAPIFLRLSHTRASFITTDLRPLPALPSIPTGLCLPAPHWMTIMWTSCPANSNSATKLMILSCGDLHDVVSFSCPNITLSVICIRIPDEQIYTASWRLTWSTIHWWLCVVFFCSLGNASLPFDIRDDSFILLFRVRQCAQFRVYEFLFPSFPFFSSSVLGTQYLVAIGTSWFPDRRTYNCWSARALLALMQ